VSEAKWRTVVALAVALHCYDLYDGRGVWQGVAIVNEDEWRFEVYDADGRTAESGAADALFVALARRRWVETPRSCQSVSTPCFGRATRC
jgi:hypothetical protein